MNSLVFFAGHEATRRVWPSIEVGGVRSLRTDYLSTRHLALDCAVPVGEARTVRTGCRTTGLLALDYAVPAGAARTHRRTAGKMRNPWWIVWRSSVRFLLKFSFEELLVSLSSYKLVVVLLVLAADVSSSRADK